MRVWDIHPGYLSRQSLLGEHSEIHALYSVISGKRLGFAMHPETERWTGHLDLLVRRHDLVVKEMILRNYHHSSPLPYYPQSNERAEQISDISYLDFPSVQFEILQQRYEEKSQSGRIPLPKNGTEFWAHHKYSVMARGYSNYKELQKYLRNRKSLPIGSENDFITKVYGYMKRDIPMAGLDNVILHLWGYFKHKTSKEEQEFFFHLSTFSEKSEILFTMAKKYQQLYLLHSTFFSDFLPNGSM